MQSLWRSARALVSNPRSFVVTPRTPFAVALLSPLFASPFFAAAMSLLADFTASSKLCWSISKLCSAAVSFFLASANWPSAFSRRLSRVEMMSLLWPSYTAADGAPKLASAELSSDPCMACTSAVSLAPSSELRADAWTRRPKACVTLEASFNCNIDAPLFCISRSRMLMARFNVSMTSVNSLSSAAKSEASFARIWVAAFRSASSEAMLPESSSILAPSDPMRAVSLEIAAERCAA
mmetsp:Transcript_68237/g.203035  ORF Transcript_68237/g.203035 Transcript_68237/m.203035 type:complete len:237 (-) Transcript_68237:127-837(-)